MIDRNTSILNFIKEFSSFGDDIIKCFTQGNCYYFSLILLNRFKQGEIFYNEIDNHFAYKDIITNKLYDITGEIISNDFISWNNYQSIDKFHCERIINQCILKIKED